MKVLFKVLPCVVASLLLVSCGFLTGEEGFFRDRGHDYLKAKESSVIPPEELPHWDALAIPTIPERELPDEFETPAPEPLLADQDRNAVKIQKLGEQSWLLVPLPPEQTWPRVRYFLESNKINIDGQDVNHGLVETGWLVDGAVENNELKEKYRIRIEQGVQRNTAEIYIQQIQQDKRIKGSIGWPPQGSVNPDRENWMQQQLAQYLANISEKASVSLMAQGISNASRVELVRDDRKNPYIVLDLPFDRAWASLGNALKKAEMTLDDMNRSEGAFFAHRKVEKANPPFFLLRWFGASTTEEKHYRFKLQQAGEQVQIRLIQDEEQPLTAKEQEDVLVLVKGFLS